MPGIGAQPHPKVKHWLEYFTQHPVGRERFEALLFRCGAYQEMIDQTLVRYGMPRALMGLVITESGCVSDIESPAGARGLWQFMPATARAYHLRVKAGVVDERISPPKATGAAIRFLTDLKRKMGSWELTLASYNMGPFGLAARVRRAGAGTTYWQLADAGLIPDETANYVPYIQAYALILENLERFGFSSSQRRAPVPTGDFEAPSGTRLSQVARAAGASLELIQSLNPDVVGPVVPAVTGPPFVLSVPQEMLLRAREALDGLLTSGDEADLCVSSTFDWGHQRFTSKMAAQCRNAN
jgi:membrane-bound lytic murein transglycosylase D